MSYVKPSIGGTTKNLRRFRFYKLLGSWRTDLFMKKLTKIVKL